MSPPLDKSSHSSQISGRHYLTGQWVTVRWESGTICDVQAHGAPENPPETADQWVCPGLCDLQVNGFGGVNFTSGQLTTEDVARVGARLAARGTTRLLATLTTADARTFDHAVAALAEAQQYGPSWLRRQLVGIHLEGPYLASDDGPRGAHPREHCRAPDWQEFQRWQQLAGGTVRMVTLAPELPGAIDFIRQATQSGVVVALGHLQAHTDQLSAAVAAGARLSTHLGNGAHAVLPRHPNYLWDQLADDRLAASLIVDGHHLPAAVVRTIVRTKTPRRSLLVSDITALAGRPPGRYRSTSLGTVDVLPDGRLVVADLPQYLAGASRHLLENVEMLSQLAEVPWTTAWEMASNYPAELMGLTPCRLEPGQPAHLVLLRQPTAVAVVDSPTPSWPGRCSWQIDETIVAGERPDATS